LAAQVIYDEQGLLSGLISGDEGAFKALYELYGESICKLIQKYLGSNEMARDVSQEVMMDIWQKREKLGHVRNIQAYLHNAARNRAIDVLRAAGRTQVAMGEIARQFNKDASYFDDETLQREYRVFVKRIVDKLPPRPRQVFLMCREEGKSYEEVAAALGISKNRVRNYMVTALNILRDATKDELGTPLTILLPVLAWLDHVHRTHL
jgi:RNA polymerase sigma-70 factor (family 1)